MRDFAEAFVAALFIVGIVVWTSKVLIEVLWTR
jgi:ribosome biogenesis protein Tsr3